MTKAGTLTRQQGANLCPEAEAVIYITQDAIPASPHAFETLGAAFENPQVGAVYGRQLPRENATPLESFARKHNYPPQSRIKTIEDIPELKNEWAQYGKLTQDPRITNSTPSLPPRVPLTQRL